MWLLIRNISGAREGKKSNTWAFVFKKKIQGNSDMYLDFKKWLQFLLLDPSFGDITFLLTNHDTLVLSE